MTTPVQEQAAVSDDSRAAPAIDLSRPIAAPVGRVWQVLVSPEGTRAWLGDGAVLGGKGEPYHCTDGTSGVVRSYHPLEQLRVSWHPDPDSPPSIIELDLRADGDATLVELHHEKIHDVALRDALHERWAGRLEALAREAVAAG